MPHQGPLRWLDGEGWLILSGGGDPASGVTDAVDAQVLSLVNLDRPMVVLLSDGSKVDAEDILEHYVALGGPGGEAFTLRSLTRDHLGSPRLIRLLEEAGTLYLGGENAFALVHALRGTPALESILQGYSTMQGLTIVGASAGASTLGTWMVGPPPHRVPVKGLDWVMPTLIVPHFTSTEDCPALRSLPAAGQFILGLGIPDGVALALGPAGQVEMWGDGQVTAVVKAQSDQETPDGTA